MFQVFSAVSPSLAVINVRINQTDSKKMLFDTENTCATVRSHGYYSKMVRHKLTAASDSRRQFQVIKHSCSACFKINLLNLPLSSGVIPARAHTHNKLAACIRQWHCATLRPHLWHWPTEWHMPNITCQQYTTLSETREEVICCWNHKLALPIPISFFI